MKQLSHLAAPCVISSHPAPHTSTSRNKHSISSSTNQPQLSSGGYYQNTNHNNSIGVAGESARSHSFGGKAAAAAAAATGGGSAGSSTGGGGGGLGGVNHSTHSTQSSHTHSHNHSHSHSHYVSSNYLNYSTHSHSHSHNYSSSGVQQGGGTTGPAGAAAAGGNMGQKSSKKSSSGSIPPASLPDLGMDVKSNYKSSKKSDGGGGRSQVPTSGVSTNKDSNSTQHANNSNQNNQNKKHSSGSKGGAGNNATGASGASGHHSSGSVIGAAEGNNNTLSRSRKCDACGVEIDFEHPETADHEATRAVHRPSKILLLETDLERSEDLMTDLAPYIDLHHKLMLTQENPSWTHKKYWKWKDCVVNVLDEDSILDLISTRRMERLFYPDYEDTTTSIFWRNLAERICAIARLKTGTIKEYDRLEFTERFVPVSATLAFDCMFAVGKKEVAYRDERNNEYTRWRDFFVIQSLYTLHEVRHFIIEWLPKKVELEGIKFTPELQLGIREVREERLENFESRSDLVTCVFFMADLDPETTSGGSRSAVGGGAGGTSGSANIMASGGSSTLPHIITLHNFWIRSYDETRARDIAKTTLCPLFDSFSREIGVNHVLRAYQSFLVLTYMNAYATQGKLILFKINGMSDNRPELSVLETKQISPTITVAASWQKIAYKSLTKPTEVSVLRLPGLAPLANVNLNPVASYHQLRIIYTHELYPTDTSKVIQTYGVSADQVCATGEKVPLNTVLSKFNQSSGLLYQTAKNCGLQINAKVKQQSATIESVLFNLEKIELLINNKEEALASTNRSATEKETKVFTLAAQDKGDSGSTPTVTLTPEMFQGILSYAILNNCLAILYHDNSCYRLIKITA